VNVLYILDEPSIGLHQRDNHRLIESLKKLRDSGNSVVVVEHDKDMMLASDYIVDMGPFAGQKGGDVVFEGLPSEMLKRTHSHPTTSTVSCRSPSPKKEKRQWEEIHHGRCIGQQSENVTVAFPLGTFICVTGVSGSGKSTLINETVQPVLSQKFYRSLKEPLPYTGVKGIEHLDKVVSVDQSPIGRTPRSNPATYTGVFPISARCLPVCRKQRYGRISRGGFLLM